jgi:hypothetical protein
MGTIWLLYITALPERSLITTTSLLVQHSLHYCPQIKENAIKRWWNFGGANA